MDSERLTGQLNKLQVQQATLSQEKVDGMTPMLSSGLQMNSHKSVHVLV